jgi:hypothetical protein
MIEIAKEYESKLTNKEKENFILRENELRLKKEIHRIKTSNYETITENKRSCVSVKNKNTANRLAANSVYKKEEFGESATFSPRRSAMCRSNTILDNGKYAFKQKLESNNDDSISHYRFFEVLFCFFLILTNSFLFFVFFYLKNKKKYHIYL